MKINLDKAYHEIGPIMFAYQALDMRPAERLVAFEVLWIQRFDRFISDYKPPYHRAEGNSWRADLFTYIDKLQHAYKLFSTVKEEAQSCFSLAIEGVTLIVFAYDQFRSDCRFR